jgi:beta-glucosidase
MDDSAKRVLDDRLDLNEVPIDSVDSATTPGTEYSPPVSPFPKKAVPKDSRTVAREKLATLNLEEKVVHLQGGDCQDKLTESRFPY